MTESNEPSASLQKPHGKKQLRDLLGYPQCDPAQTTPTDEQDAAPETVLTPEMETGTRKTIVRKAVRISNPSLLTWHGALLGQRLAE